MAHFAELNGSNVVQRVTVIDSKDILDGSGNESEALGIAICKHHFGASTNWKQCSYHGTIRKNYPGVGWEYDTTHDFFRCPRPTDNDGDTCNSWTLNTSTAEWDPPITRPLGGYYWDESVYQGDNTKGWVAYT